MLYNRVPESITIMKYSSLYNQLQNGLGNKLYYTPKLQRIGFTQELAKYLRFIDRKDRIREEDMRAVVEAVLIQYGTVHHLEEHPKFKGNVDYSITKNYEFKANQLSPYHGTVDYMLWLN